VTYQFSVLRNGSGAGARYPIGHAMIWRPSNGLRLRFIVSFAAIERDFVAIPGARKYERSGTPAAPHPGYTVREAVERFPGGVAYFNAGEMGLLNFPIILDGRLVTKPGPARSLRQQQWAPLNDDYTFFIQHADGRVQVRDVPIRDNQLVQRLPENTHAFSAPYILREGWHVPLRNPAPGQPPNARQVLFPGGKTRAPISALGLASTGEVVRVSLLGDLEHPEALERLPTEYDLVEVLLSLNVVDALYTGASGDVQYYDRATGTLCVGRERAKSPDARWLLREGQTERGLTLIAVLLPAEMPG
jgi:hypothetical protein